jgi:hypothetical protein
MFDVTMEKTDKTRQLSSLVEKFGLPNSKAMNILHLHETDRNQQMVTSDPSSSPPCDADSRRDRIITPLNRNGKSYLFARDTPDCSKPRCFTSEVPTFVLLRLKRLFGIPMHGFSALPRPVRRLVRAPVTSYRYQFQTDCLPRGSAKFLCISIAWFCSVQEIPESQVSNPEPTGNTNRNIRCKSGELQVGTFMQGVSRAGTNRNKPIMCRGYGRIPRRKPD